MNTSTRKRLLYITLSVIVGGLLVYGFWPQALPVETAKVTRGVFEETLEEEGHTRIRDRYVVTAPVAGYAQRIDLDVGDRVQQGQTLLSLEPLRSEALDPRRHAQATARVQAAEAALNAAREHAQVAATDVELTTTDVRRMQALYDAGSVTQQALDQVSAAARRAQASARAARAAVEGARFELKAAQSVVNPDGAATSGGAQAIRAPVSGHVLQVHHKSEGVVAAGHPLLELGDARALDVVVDVLSSDAVRMDPGTRVRFERWGGDLSLEGRVRVVEPTAFTHVSALGVEEQRVRLVADVVSPAQEWARLGDGYRVLARFIVWGSDDVLQVPSSALFRDGENWAVFVVEGGRAYQQVVDLGRRSGLQAQIVSGLTDNQQVVLHPDDNLEDGDRVRIR